MERVNSIEKRPLGHAGGAPHLGLVASLLIKLEAELGLSDRLQTRRQHLEELERRQPLLLEPLVGQEAGGGVDLPQGHPPVVTDARVDDVKGDEVIRGVDQLPLDHGLLELVVLEAGHPAPACDQEPLYDQDEPVSGMERGLVLVQQMLQRHRVADVAGLQLRPQRLLALLHLAAGQLGPALAAPVKTGFVYSVHLYSLNAPVLGPLL